MKFFNWFKENKLLLLLIFIGAIFRFYKIDFQSVWLDEIHTINESNPNISISELHSSLLASDPHPPLYFILVQLFFKIFGYSTFVLKTFSALMGIGGLLAIYFLGKEIMNKKVGLIAVMLLSVNYFHIYYSQEARMYSMLFFTTTLSFYFLVRFLKNPSIKTVILHAVFAALMIYTHFFALFALFAEYVILLLFIIKPHEIDRKKMLLFSILSGFITLILYTPSFKTFVETAKRTSIWIPMPSIDVYTQIFKEFFGQSEIVIFFILTLLIFFFIKLYNRENKEELSINPNEEKQIFSFILLFCWIIITLLIPLISSYVKLPMLISRYFINILPAIILLIAIGIYYIKNNVVKLAILSIFVIFSLTDIIIVKRYYRLVVKTQFREATQFIIDNNSSKDNVVTSLGWYLPYFLNNEENKNTIIDKSLDVYVSEMSQDVSKIKSFWYFDGHIRPYNPSEETKLFLENNYVLDKNIDLYDCYAKHFIIKSNFKPKIDIVSFYPLKDRNGDNINFSVEVFDNSQEKISISGWAYFDKQVASNSKIQLLAIKDNQIEMIFNESVRREDVTSYFKSLYDISNSGFKAVFSKLKYGKGTYKIAIYILDNQNHKKGLVITDKFFTID
jgi:4-amino-4-deoxy-L-arabinose transferase-like glycosyltransferase